MRSPVTAYDSSTRATCPECKAGKHDNCHGDAWDNEHDKPAICFCWVHGHEPPDE